MHRSSFREAVKRLPVRRHVTVLCYIGPNRAWTLQSLLGLLQKLERASGIFLPDEDDNTVTRYAHLKRTRAGTRESQACHYEKRLPLRGAAPELKGTVNRGI